MRVYFFLVILSFFSSCTSLVSHKPNDTLNIDSYPDFSFVGYKYNEVSFLKNMANYKIFNVLDFGAIPNDNFSDEEAIRKAILKADEEKGGIIYLPKGKYLVNTDLDNPGYNPLMPVYEFLRSPKPIILKNGNIIIRGEKNSKSEDGGTEIFMVNELRSNTPEKLWTTPFLFDLRGKNSHSEAISTIVKDGKIGDFSLQLNNVANLKEGDWVTLFLNSSDNQLLKNTFQGKKIESSWKVINKNIIIKERHKISKIDTSSNTLFFAEPLKTDISTKYPWKISYFSHIEELGIENIYFSGNFHEYLKKDNNGVYKHHKNITHDGGWSIINLGRVTNSWINNCSFENVTRSISLFESAAVTVSNINITGSPGHNAVSVASSMGILVANIYDTSSTWHASGISNGQSIGNVFWNNFYNSDTTFESHGGQPRHTLFDNITGGLINNHWGGDKKDLPNHMEGLILWNYNNTNSSNIPFTFWQNGDSHNKILFPRIIGLHGNSISLNDNELFENISFGKKITPLSLFEYQLTKRLGYFPEYLKTKKQGEK